MLLAKWWGVLFKWPRGPFSCCHYHRSLMLSVFHPSLRVPPPWAAGDRTTPATGSGWGAAGIGAAAVKGLDVRRISAQRRHRTSPRCRRTPGRAPQRVHHMVPGGGIVRPKPTRYAVRSNASRMLIAESFGTGARVAGAAGAPAGSGCSAKTSPGPRRQRVGRCRAGLGAGRWRARRRPGSRRGWAGAARRPCVARRAASRSRPCSAACRTVMVSPQYVASVPPRCHGKAQHPTRDERRSSSPSCTQQRGETMAIMVGRCVGSIDSPRI